MKSNNFLQSIFRKVVGLKSDDLSNNVDIKVVRNHPIFTEMRSWRSVKIYTLDIKDPSKKAMSSEYLNIILTEFESVLNSTYVETIEDMAKLLTGQSLFNLLDDIVTRATINATTKCIPYIFLDKFNVRISNHIQVTVGAVNELQLFRNWSSDTDKVLATLDILYTSLHIIANEVAITVNTMNGELALALKGSPYDVSV